LIPGHAYAEASVSDEVKDEHGLIFKQQRLPQPAGNFEDSDKWQVISGVALTHCFVIPLFVHEPV
jgi:hypothetical protein